MMEQAGSVNGTAALITAQYPLALYLHCTSYCLNLAVVKSLQVTSVRNMMGVVDRFFAAHPKRQQALEEAILSTQPSSAHAIFVAPGGSRESMRCRCFRHSIHPL